MSDPGLDAVLAQLWAGFVPLAQSRVEALEEYARLLDAGDDDPGLRASARAAAHKLAGTLGTYGRQGSDEASRLEVLLAPAADRPDPLEVGALVRVVRAAVDA